MLDSHINELDVKEVDQIRLALADFNLFDEGLQKYLHRDCLIFFKNGLQVSQHELPHCEFLMVLYEEEGDLFVNDRGIRVLFICEFVQQFKHHFH